MACYKEMAEQAIARLAGLLESGVLEMVYKSPAKTASAVLTIVAKMEAEAFQRGVKIELPSSIVSIKMLMTLPSAAHDIKLLLEA